jgi:hypothetical protein
MEEKNWVGCEHDFYRGELRHADGVVMSAMLPVKEYGYAAVWKSEDSFAQVVRRIASRGAAWEGRGRAEREE